MSEEPQVYMLEERLIKGMFLPQPSMEGVARAATREAFRVVLQHMDRYCNKPSSDTDRKKAAALKMYDCLGDDSTAEDLRLEIELFIINGKGSI